MKKYRWFILTFVLWSLLGLAAGWALISNSSHGSRTKIAGFDAAFNGESVSNELYSTQVSPPDAEKETAREWEAEGWERTSGKLNLASVLLRLPATQAGLLSPLGQIELFHHPRKERFRILGLLADPNEGATHEWVFELPQSALNFPDLSACRFPFKVPGRASEVRNIRLGKLEILFWVMPRQGSPPETMARLGASQGYSSRPLFVQNGEAALVLKKGPTELFATIQDRGKKSSILICQTAGD